DILAIEDYNPVTISQCDIIILYLRNNILIDIFIGRIKNTSYNTGTFVKEILSDVQNRSSIRDYKELILVYFSVLLDNKLIRLIRSTLLKNLTYRTSGSDI